jgi:hypothetical protein
MNTEHRDVQVFRGVSIAGASQMIGAPSFLPQSVVYQGLSASGFTAWASNSVFGVATADAAACARMCVTILDLLNKKLGIPTSLGA